MAKAPAFQFYGKDWLADVELQAASASTRGIWINALCLMWESRTRGTISGPESIMPRRLNCTAEEFSVFLVENESLKFADVTICNGVVTLSNRRMVKEEKIRNQTRLRVQRHRGNAACNADKTPSSSSSSPSTKVLSRDTPSNEGVLSSEPSASADVTSTGEPEMGAGGQTADAVQAALPGTETGTGTPKRTQDRTPHEAIVAMYHEILPMCPRVKVWNPEQRSRLRTRWNESPERKSLDWWREFFQRVAASDWLTGRVKDFVCDLDWLVGPKNMAKVLNGRFDNRGPRTGSHQTDRNVRAAQAFIQGD